jgi:D-glycero-D-manno-heptose 1,7-bisphosphate phosphatase
VTGPRAAVFLDRDGTLVEDPGYLNDPARVHLLPGAGEAAASLKRAGYLLIIVTNQSGIARGLITPAQYEAVAGRTAELLAQAGGAPDAQYHCPHLPEISGACECRKPGLLLYRQAIEQFGIDPARSWWVGDRISDLLPGITLGGRVIGIGPGLVESGGAATQFPTELRLERDLAGAVRVILGQE